MDVRRAAPCAAHNEPAASRPSQTPPPLDREAALFLDVDGTLLDIAPRPELVRIPAGLPQLLDRLGRERGGALALVSGRPLRDIDHLFRPWAGAAAGLHGAERRRANGDRASRRESEADAAAARALAELRPRLAELTRAIPSTWLEDKGGTLALHYRSVPERQPELRQMTEALLADHPDHLRLIDGKMVLEFQPRHHGKDAAIAAFLAEPPFSGRCPVFVGDDTTDEDGFAEVNRHGGWSVRVGSPAPTAAIYSLPSVAAVHAWLAGNPSEKPERRRN